LDDYGAAGLLGQLSGRERDLVVTDLHRDAVLIKTTHEVFIPFAPGWGGVYIYLSDS
jgi:hypothetical protein